MAETEDFLKKLLASYQAARLYHTEHPQFTQSIDKAFDCLKDIVADRGELSIAIVDKEFSSGNEIYFDLSESVLESIQYLKDRGIEKISFNAGIKREELVKFIEYLLSSNDSTNTDIPRSLMSGGVKNIVISKLGPGKANTPEKVDEVLVEADLYDIVLQNVSHSLTSMINNEAFDYFLLKSNLFDLIDTLRVRTQDYQKFVRIPGMILSAHLLNVATLSMALASELGFTRDDIFDVGVSGLFHDIGKSYISRNVVDKKSEFLEDEFEKMTSHTILGAQIMLNYMDTLGITPVVVCYEHHLRYDLKGYPKSQFIEKPHEVSLIVGLCDVYDALNERRSYKKSYQPEYIYDLMLKGKGKSFHPDLFDTFFRVVGVWPAGTIVQLNDDRVAVVRETNKDDIYSPEVEIISSSSTSGERIDLRREKGKISIKQSLNPTEEGRQYLPFI
jgi:putative nucleotidyltransferase with HDIG domain